MRVFCVLKNADFTEGGGPMLLHKVFADDTTAESYIMDQHGIFGSTQGKSSVRSNGRAYYNGYEVVPMDVLNEYVPVIKQAFAEAEIQVEIAELNDRIATLQRKLDRK